MQQKQAIVDFWNYFETEHHNLIDQDKIVNEALYLELVDKLKKVHEDLCLEVGHHATPYELVISADGIDDVFEFVEMLDVDKPQIPGWQILKYRQHIYDIEDKSITIGEETFKLSEIFYDLILDDEVGIVLVIFIPGFDEDNNAHEMMRWVILDNTIGEYDAVKKVGYFATYSTKHMKELGKNITSNFKTLRHLKKDLDDLWTTYTASFH
jgi:hypothetical protein